MNFALADGVWERVKQPQANIRGDWLQPPASIRNSSDPYMLRVQGEATAHSGTRTLFNILKFCMELQEQVFFKTLAVSLVLTKHNEK